MAHLRKLAALTPSSPRGTETRVSVVMRPGEGTSPPRAPGLVPILGAQSPAGEGELSLLPGGSAQFESSKNVFEWKEKAQGSAGILLKNREKFD